MTDSFLTRVKRFHGTSRELLLDGLAGVIAATLDLRDYLARHAHLPNLRREGVMAVTAGVAVLMAMGFSFVTLQSAQSSLLPTDTDAPQLAVALTPPSSTAPVARETETAATKTDSATEPQIASLAAPRTEASADAIAGTPPDNAPLALPDTGSDVTLETDEARLPVETTVTVAKGDTFGRILEKANIVREDRVQAFTALRKVFDPRDLRAGQKLTLVHEAPQDDATPVSLQAISFSPAPAKTIRVERSSDAEGFAAKKEEAEQHRMLVRARGAIESSLSQAAADGGIPAQVMAEFIFAYSFDVDFQRDIRKGDSFELMYEMFQTEDGTVVRYGRVLFAAMTLSGDEKAMYRFTNDLGFTDYYDAKGRSVRKALMRTPINGARITSGFGKRKHPILGYSKMHKGIDFGAVTGTPILAAGNGVVERARWVNGYGKYVRIRHNGTYSTAYAHMSAWAKGVKEGTRVKQGQVIGYVGTTGRSTGPHLHFEILKNGVQVNPLKVRLPSGTALAGKELKTFESQRQRVDTQLAALAPSGEPVRATEVASAK